MLFGIFWDGGKEDMCFYFVSVLFVLLEVEDSFFAHFHVLFAAAGACEVEVDGVKVELLMRWGECIWLVREYSLQRQFILSMECCNFGEL